MSSTSRITTTFTRDHATLLRQAFAEGWDVFASLEAVAVKLTEESARHQGWQAAPQSGEDFCGLVAAFLPPGDGRTFSDRITGAAHGDEQLVTYVLAADPEHLVVTLSVWPDDESEWASRWTVTAQPGETLGHLVSLLVTAAQAAVDQLDVSVGAYSA